MIVTNEMGGFKRYAADPESSPSSPGGPRVIQAYTINNGNGQNGGRDTHVVAAVSIANVPPPFMYRHEGTVLQGGPPRPATVQFEMEAFCGRRDVVTSFGAVAPSDVTCPRCAIAIAPLWRQRVVSWHAHIRARIGAVTNAFWAALRPQPRPADGNLDDMFNMVGGMASPRDPVWGMQDTILTLRQQIVELRGELSAAHGGVPLDDVEPVGDGADDPDAVEADLEDTPEPDIDEAG